MLPRLSAGADSLGSASGWRGGVASGQEVGDDEL